MTPGDYPLELYRGDSRRWRFSFSSKSPSGVVTPFNLTGVTPKAEIRDKPTGGKLIAPLTCTLTLPNVVDVALLAEDSKQLLSKGAWDLQFTYASGDVLTFIAGAVTATGDVTDSMTGAQ
jgi:hypothetical protein